MDMTPNTFYVAGRVGTGERDVRAVGDALVARGWRWSFDWTDPGTAVRKPYLDHVATNASTAEAMRAAAGSSELVVLVWADDLLGALIETGIAVGQLDGHRRLVIVGADARQSVFWCLPGVHVVDDLAGLCALLDSGDR